jgi:hypothetical protein
MMLSFRESPGNHRRTPTIGRRDRIRRASVTTARMGRRRHNEQQELIHLLQQWEEEEEEERIEQEVLEWLEHEEIQDWLGASKKIMVERAIVFERLGESACLYEKSKCPCCVDFVLRLHGGSTDHAIQNGCGILVLDCTQQPV